MTEKIDLSWDEKVEKAKEAIKASFWGDFLFGGLVVSGIFIFIESLELPSLVNCSIGILIFIFGLSLILSRLIYFRIKTYQIEKIIKKAEIYQSEKDYKKSLELLNKELEDTRNLKIKEIWNNKAIALYYLTRYEEAYESFNYALEIDPFYKFAILGKGAALYKLKRFEEALKSYDKALTIDQNYKEAWLNKGYVLHDLKRYKEALESYDKALDIDRSYKEAWLNKGYVLHDLKRYQEALESYNKALAIDQNYKKAWFNKGCLFKDLKEYQNALESYDKALAIDQNYKIIKHV